MRFPQWKWPALAGFAASLLIAAPCGAEWPTARHDARRTGASASAGNIAKPGQYWRSYLGGAPAAQALLVGDTNGDNELDVLYAAGGRLLLRRPDGEVLWQTPNLGFVSIADVVSLDGDGIQEVIALSPSRASVVDGSTGTILWQQDPDEMGTLTTWRMAHFDGDGTPDLFLDRCGCCAVETTSPGEIYSFANGLSTPQKLGPLPPRSHCGSSADTLGDWDGDGVLELMLPSNDSLLLVSSTGDLLGASGAIAPYIGVARCEAHPIDSAPGDEAICIHSAVVGGVKVGMVFALTYRPGNPIPVQMLWQAAFPEPAFTDIRAADRLAWDLDGDGASEVVVNVDSPGGWGLHVLDGASGVEMAVLPSHILQGILPFEGDPRAWLVTTDESSGQGVVAWQYDAPAQFTERWAFADRSVPLEYDRPSARLSAFGFRMVASDLDGNGRVEVVLGTSSEPAQLHLLRTDGTDVVETASYDFGAGVDMTALATPRFTDKALLAVSRNDGYLALLDGEFNTLNLLEEGTETLPGMRIGTYYTGAGGLFTFGRTPLSAKLDVDKTAESVLVVDGRGDLCRIDPGGASNVSPAKPTWRLQDSFGAGVAPVGSGEPARIGVFRRRHPVAEPPSYFIATVDSAGAQLADVPLAKPPAWDVMPGDLDGDGSLDFAALTVDGTNSTDVLAFRATGELLWQQNVAAQYGTSPASLADWDGDGAQDVAITINTARIYDGPTGAVAAESGGFLAYFMPLLADTTGDGALEMTLQGGLFPARTLSHDLTATLWQGTEDDRPYQYGALASCNGTTRLVEGSLAFPSRLAITTISGPAAGERVTRILAGGGIFLTEDEAVDAGAQLGQLGDVAVSANLSGSDATPTALVGSTDGYLYAVDPCDAFLRWAHGFEAPVGAPILADTDGDGADDILVSVADGYLYGLRHEVLPAPDFVWDVDLPKGQIEEDIDEIETRDTLHALWGPVEQATSYEVAVVGAAGTYLTSPDWIDVGNATSATLSALPLSDGGKYYVGVRAVSPSGRSPDRPTDGVVVRFASGAGGGGGGGGGAGAGSAEPKDDLLLWGRGCACGLAGGGGSAAGLGAWAAALALCATRRLARRSRFHQRSGPGKR